VEFNRDGLAVNSFDEAGVPGLGYGPGAVTPSGFDSNVSTADSTVDCQTVRKPGLQPAPEASLAMHIQASVTPKCLDRAGAASSGGGQHAKFVQNTGTHTQTPTSATAPTRVDSTTQPDAPAVDPGARPSTGSTPRRDPHPFLTTENALAYAKDPRMEGPMLPLMKNCQVLSKIYPMECSLPPKREELACRRSTWQPTMPPSSYLMES